MRQYKFINFSQFCMLVLAIGLTGCSDEKEIYLEGIEVEAGLKLELVAAEPLVIDPVAYAFDETGKMYVVENRGYPDPAEGGSPAVREGRIVLLEDTDGDGEYDQRHEFADGFTYPNGILPWKGGVFVTCSPDIWYLKDADGDGKAEVREVVLTGFFDTRTAQIRTSHPTLGLDGWVYVSSGLNGGKVYSPLFPDRDTVSFTASDGRFNPETFEFESVGGKSQFGMAFDAYGHRFGVSNRHPIMEVVIEPEYLNRNPYLPYNQTVQNVSKVAAEAVVFPLSNAVTTADFIPNLMGQSHKGTFTAASSTYIYYGLGLPLAHQGNAYISESAQNLVQRQIFQPDGATFRSVLAYEGQEFVASADEWFRPVYVNNGPEDALYVVDMHRKVIDHPSYVPEEVRGLLDFESGKDMGRIFKVSSETYDSSLEDKIWFEGGISGSELVESLNAELFWDRQTAFRLLLERTDEKLTTELEKIALNSTYPDTRARALWLLHHKGGLKNTILLDAFVDPEPGVREQAVILAADRAREDQDLMSALLKTIDDKSMHVLLKTALVLGSIDGEQATDALAALAAKNGEDLWMREAILSGVGDRMVEFLDALEAQPGKNDLGYALIMKDLGKMFGNGATIAQCRQLASVSLNEDGPTSSGIGTILGLAEGVSSRPEARGNKEILSFLLSSTSLPKRTSFIQEVYKISRDTTAALQNRINAVSLLGYTQDSKSLPVLQALLTPDQLPELQKAAIGALSSQGSRAGGEILVTREIWGGFTPQVRSTVITSLVSNPVFVPMLLKAITEKVVSASDIPSITRQRLMSSQNSEIKSLAEAAFSELEGGDRMKVYDNYKATLGDGGDPENGKMVFKKACGVCHTYDGEGGQVGPDLTGIKNQPADAILLHIVVPNYEVYPTYQTMSVETRDGKHVAGWTVSETESSVTLRTASGSDESILRSSIKSLNNTGLSLMPDGMEQAMSQGEMNDLIAYLKTGSSFNN
ncbi:MAG TPA: PVC-type heme-binding CxxCH protein [Membranihabitans sp.]|nr:PVC-type heme-binding CxxCH protein [Membranihabitans sp.]